MSLRLEMMQVARLAPKCLGESAALVRNFLLGQQNPDGGFKDRSGRSDLYTNYWLRITGYRPRNHCTNRGIPSSIFV